MAVGTVVLGRMRARLALYAATTLVGIGLSALYDETFGALVTVASMVMLVWTLHKFGRTGPD